MSSPAAAALIHKVAEQALAAQVGRWRDLRGRVATLATIAPAAAVVVVTATGDKVDLLALLALVALALAVGQSLVAIWQAATRATFTESPTLVGAPPSDTRAADLDIALAQRTDELRADNESVLERFERMFLRAVTGFLAAVLLWSIHAATGSEILFHLG